jgi:dTDP-4-dehydrorhamnose 3,5-epimerase
MLKINKSAIDGCFEFISNSYKDQRGEFVKIYQNNHFQELGIHENLVEEYYTVSFKNVIRGMHFQSPPHDHIKIVNCIEGEIFDAIIDLRVNSTTYGKVETFYLSESKKNGIFVPKGLAHGFCVLSERAVLLYKTSTPHSLVNDSGILYNSIGIDWPVKTPILSERDLNLKPFFNFDSPFKS